MSVVVDMVSKGKDLPELLEWLAKILRAYPDQRWCLRLSLSVVKQPQETPKEEG